MLFNDKYLSLSEQGYHSLELKKKSWQLPDFSLTSKRFLVIFHFTFSSASLEDLK